MCQTPKNEAETAGFRRGRPVALSAEERRTEIFAALESIYEDAGLDGATMDCLAKRAAMSKRTLYSMFPSRTALLRAYLHQVGDDFIRPLTAEDRTLPIAERLERILSQRPRQQGCGLPLEVLRLIITETPAMRDVGRELVDRIIAVDHRIIADELDLGVARGEIVIEDTMQAAALLLDMIRPWPLESLLDPARLPTPLMMNERRSLAIRVFLNGFTTNRD
ncbi:TetR/AcrR family transcriptional regulator [Roseovarius sp.]|uniref:TetR/AcrR family transcriptional regulator n=1 Tax=Roseovarius sp. TaxID=1486281 RepID=UPI0026157674|nr:TetR/AcrR family transcriptional regulator [Roseovarius sp.]